MFKVLQELIDKVQQFDSKQRNQKLTAETQLNQRKQEAESSIQMLKDKVK
jgi:hypothetical protein